MAHRDKYLRAAIPKWEFKPGGNALPWMRECMMFADVYATAVVTAVALAEAKSVVPGAARALAAVSAAVSSIVSPTDRQHLAMKVLETLMDLGEATERCAG